MGYRTPSVAGSMGDDRGPMGDEMCLEYCKTMQIAGSTGGERCLEYGKTVQIAGSMGGERCLEYGKTLQIAAFAQEGALSASRCCSCLGMKKTCLQRPHFQLSTPNKKKFGFFIGNAKGTFGRGYCKDMGSVKFTCQAMQSQSQGSKNIKEIKST